MLDITNRNEASRLGDILEVAFKDITVYTTGRIVVEGTRESLIENLSFRDVLMRMTGYESFEKVHKMRGGAKRAASRVPDCGPRHDLRICKGDEPRWHHHRLAFRSPDARTLRHLQRSSAMTFSLLRRRIRDGNPGYLNRGLYRYPPVN